MTDEVRKVIEAIKEAFEVFERMELPIAEREYTLSHNAAMALINELERLDVTNESTVCGAWQSCWNDLKNRRAW